MENLKSQISEKTHKEIELFLVNTNLDSLQRAKLIMLMSKIFSEGKNNEIYKRLKLVPEKFKPTASYL